MKRTIHLLLSVLIVAGPAALMAEGVQDFNLVNQTGFTIKSVYVSPSAQNEWGDDIMDVDVVENGQTVEVSFPAEEGECLWDLKVEDMDGNAVFWEKIDLCKYEKITLHYKNGKAWATFE